MRRNSIMMLLVLGENTYTYARCCQILDAKQRKDALKKKAPWQIIMIKLHPNMRLINSNAHPENR